MRRCNASSHCFNSLQTGTQIASWIVDGTRPHLAEFQFPSNGKAERKFRRGNWRLPKISRFNSLQTGTRSARRIQSELPAETIYLEVSIPFKRESGAQDGAGRLDTEDLIKLAVSIPFKRERGSQVAPVCVHADITLFQFPSNGNADRKIQILTLKVLTLMFQFPSNGNADRKQKLCGKPTWRTQTFQFPSNGKADRKIDGFTMEMVEE